PRPSPRIPRFPDPVAQAAASAVVVLHYDPYVACVVSDHPSSPIYQRYTRMHTDAPAHPRGATDFVRRFLGCGW
ncbi:hypothetical protein, partial [Mycobacterium riyadhense]